jgi:hypothetical protein
LIRFWNLSELQYQNQQNLSNFKQCVSTKLNMMINEEVFQVYKNFAFAIFCSILIANDTLNFAQQQNIVDFLPQKVFQKHSY